MSRTEQKISSLGEVEDRSRCKEIGSSFKENRHLAKYNCQDSKEDEEEEKLHTRRTVAKQERVKSAPRLMCIHKQVCDAGFSSSFSTTTPMGPKNTSVLCRCHRRPVAWSWTTRNNCRVRRPCNLILFYHGVLVWLMHIVICVFRLCYPLVTISNLLTCYCAPATLGLHHVLYKYVV